MRHRKARTKLGRPAAHRKALLRNLTIELIRHERIKTTHSKARALRSTVAKMITLAKRQDLSSRRHVLSFIPDEDIVTRLFDELAPRYENRNGGYTRIYKLGPRRGDGAAMVFIELVDRQTERAVSEEPKKRGGLRRLFGGRKEAQPDK